MAGSLKWFIYTADSGTQFCVYRDESNLEAVNGAVGDYPDTGSTVVNGLPSNMKMRTAAYTSANAQVRRVIPCLTAAIYNALAPGATITDQSSGLTLTLVSKQGERVRLPKGQDTGLTDTDAT